MNKTELIKAIETKASLTNKRDAGKVLDAALAIITEQLIAGETVTLTGFGTFEVKDRAATTARNPRTGEVVAVPEKKVPTFRPGKALKDAVK